MVKMIPVSNKKKIKKFKAPPKRIRGNKKSNLSKLKEKKS